MKNGDVRIYQMNGEHDMEEWMQLIEGPLEGLCHGDLKAVNELVNDSRRGMLCDFGLAMLLDSENSTRLTKSRPLSCRWASPEPADCRE